MSNQEVTKKKFYKQWWFWLIVIVVLYAIGSTNKPADPVSQTPSATAQPEKTAPSVVEMIKVTAPQILSEYKANEVAADSKYKGKVIEVSGTIDAIGKDILDNPYVSLKDSAGEIFVVQCMFQKGDQNQLAPLTKDSAIKLSGKVSGKMGNLIINDCSIVK